MEYLSRPISRRGTLTILHNGWRCLLTKLSQSVFLKICIFVLTTPWGCLRMPVNHILQMPTGELQTRRIEVWCGNKKGEYCYVAMSGAVVASAVTASFSWDGFQVNASWFTRGTWYGSIILSLISVMVAFHHIILFANFGTDPQGPRKVLKVISKNGKPDFIFLYILQVPVMLLSFSLMSYFMGLSLLVVFPLWEEEWGVGMKIAMMYLGYLVFGGLNYIFVCSVVYTKCHSTP